MNGQRRIRTFGEFAPTAIFKTAALSRSAICPQAYQMEPGGFEPPCRNAQLKVDLHASLPLFSIGPEGRIKTNYILVLFSTKPRKSSGVFLLSLYHNLAGVGGDIAVFRPQREPARSRCDQRYLRWHFWFCMFFTRTIMLPRRATIYLTRPVETSRPHILIYPEGLEPSTYCFGFVYLSALPGLYLHPRLYVRVGAVKSLHLLYSNLQWCFIKYNKCSNKAWLGVDMEIKVLCKTCNKETKNPKFCSRSCAALYNNKDPNVRRRTKTKQCKTCSTLVYSHYTYCSDCFKARGVDWATVSYDELRGKAKYQKNSRIRDLARRKLLKTTQKQECSVCGYDKHVHVCHKKAISDFPGTTTISEINSIDNLVYLCPNCHWEFDNNLLSF